ncbi:MAG TPA: hypothetical protein VMC08_11000 [Bacteroidales bacterium]|nr:hypothetical protein [Bacteroidales bacterium]
MPEMHLHIIAFDIPWPANYGGVIDVFYKIRALNRAGVKIHLHCFVYHRLPAPDLEAYCEEIHYYRRKTGLFSALGMKPYIVFSRRSGELLKNLTRDRYPILFEGLHSCYYLAARELKDRVKIYRESNIEHHYYYHLSIAEKNLFRKLYFRLSSLKLKSFQKNLEHASLMLAVSKGDTEYLSRKFPGKQVEYLPSFHHDEEVNILPGKGDFALYQGNLSIPENIRAAEYLIHHVFSFSHHKLVVAGLNPAGTLERLARQYPNVEIISSPSDEEMFRLIRTAQVNIMVTFQPTGLKLKLLNALFNGRFCLVNPEMVMGTELEGLCEVGSHANDLIRLVDDCMRREFSEEMIRLRKDTLMNWHSNEANCKRLLDFVYLLVPSVPEESVHL